jgi:hypothetical protein
MAAMNYGSQLLLFGMAYLDGKGVSVLGKPEAVCGVFWFA